MEPAEVVIGTDEVMGNSLPDDVIAEAKEAVAKAVAEAGGPTPEYTAPEKVAEAEAAKAAPAEQEMDRASILKKIKQREAIQAERNRAREEADTILAKAREEQQQARWMMEEVKRQAALFSSFKTDPVKAVRAAGYDPDEFLLKLAEAGSPEEKARAAEAARKAQWEEYQAQQEKRLAELNGKITERERREQAEQRASIEQKFTSLVSNEEKHPFAAALYKNNAKGLLQEGDRVALEYWQATGGKYDRNGNPVGGEHATIEEIAEYLDQKAEEFYLALQGAKRASNSGTPTPKAPKGKTISNSASSERRALGKDLSNMTDEELIEEAKAQVKVAIASSGGL